MISIRSSLLLLGLTTSVACSDDPPSATADTGESTSLAGDSSGAEPCTPGYEGCSCAQDGLCLDGLSCLSNLCVETPDDETSTDAPAETGNPEGSSSATSDDTSGALSAGSETGETTSADLETSSGEDESSTTALEPECLEGDNYCAEAELQTCVAGQWETSTCEEHCLAIGYHSPGCANADACTCEGWADDFCFYGAAAYCLCDGSGCEDEWLYELYDYCIAGEPILDCFHGYLDQDTYDIDCAAAQTACL